MHTEAERGTADQTGARQTDAHTSPVLSWWFRCAMKLVVYDNPDDACVPVIERLRERFPTLRGVHNDVARGLLPALRAGVAAARGQYVLIYAADEIGPVLATTDGAGLRVCQHHTLCRRWPPLWWFIARPFPVARGQYLVPALLCDRAERFHHRDENVPARRLPPD
jgi:hypothetical protein